MVDALRHRVEERYALGQTRSVQQPREPALGVLVGLRGNDAVLYQLQDLRSEECGMGTCCSACRWGKLAW